MPDGNQIGLFCCQTRCFRKDVAAASWQWDVFRGVFSRGERGTESSKRFPSKSFMSYKSDKSYKSYESDKSFFDLFDLLDLFDLVDL
jgi:hypothetical protein